MRSPKSSGKQKRLRFPFSFRRVQGNSMNPTFKHGAIVAIAKYHRPLQLHDVVIFEHNGLEKIKRIHGLNDDGLFVIGDNHHESTDSRVFGLITYDAVMGKVITRRGLSHDE